MKTYVSTLVSMSKAESTKSINISDAKAADKLAFITEQYGLTMDDPDEVVTMKRNIHLVKEDGSRLKPRELMRMVDDALAFSSDKKVDTPVFDAAIDAYSAGEYDDAQVLSLDLHRKVRNLNDAQKVQYLVEANDLNLSGEVSKDVFGGENVIATLRAIREMSEEEFNATFGC